MHASDHAGQCSWCPSISGSTTRHPSGNIRRRPIRSPSRAPVISSIA
ncbi:MAG TPA: hypothetical protein VF838_09795 [Trebonia sp.]